MKNFLKPSTERVLIPLGLTAAVSAAGIGIHRNIFGSGTATLIISNDEIENIMKIVFENSGL